MTRWIALLAVVVATLWSSIVVIDGLSKPKRSAARPQDYRRALSFRDEFRRRRSVLS